LAEEKREATGIGAAHQRFSFSNSAKVKSKDAERRRYPATAD
jgi:hypothetical protein